ncbi:MAG: hypothetical protein NC191_09875 [Muribaculaceae bacterium]|nr:hypothetical protein [Muribaculaceae bacterium]
MNKVFGFLKSTTQFIKVIIVFYILMMLIYWILNLANCDWNWMNIFKPVLDSFLKTGENISDGSLNLFAAVFEFKYALAILIMLGLYLLTHVLFLGIEKFEDLYDDGTRAVKKIQENAFNKAMAQKNTSEQSQIQTYKIFVSASIKKKFSHKELNINLDEQLNIMNKFLMDKTSVIPEKFENGFVYTFNRFNDIDLVLENFFKLLKAQTPLNYIICVQIVEKNIIEAQNKLKTLISLNFENKISMLADTSYRYKFNKAHRYGTSQLGLFNKGNDTFEAHEFIEI